MRNSVWASVIATAILVGPVSAQESDPLFDPADFQDRINDLVRLIEAFDPQMYTLPNPNETRYFALSDGGIGQLAQNLAGNPRDNGAFLLEAMAGSALVQDYRPTGGPDCDPEQEDPLIVYFGFFADPNASVMSVNAGANVGAVIATGRAVRYRPGPTFCADHLYVTEAPAPAFLYVPFATQGYSFRNFTAMGLSAGGAVQGMFATSGFSAGLRGYASDNYFGTSAASGDMPGTASIGNDMMQQVLASNPQAAAALAQVPGAMPGANNEGSISLDLSSVPANAIAGNNAPYTYVQSRMVHTGRMITPGGWYQDLIDAVRVEGVVLENEPATPNGGSIGN